MRINAIGLAAALRAALKLSGVSNQIVGERTCGYRTWLRYTHQSGIACSEQRGTVLARNLDFLIKLRDALGISADEILNMAEEFSRLPSPQAGAPAPDSEADCSDHPESA
jgi:hypothetical protein